MIVFEDLLEALRTRLGIALGIPQAISRGAPTSWLALALLARCVRADVLEAYAMGVALKIAIRAVRAGSGCLRQTTGP